ncbi:MAG: hypothetical protein P8X82_14705, partial [Gemmatimonadales bacterium]
MRHVLGSLAALSLMVFPGSWISCLLLGGGYGWWPRLLIGATLSPLVLVAQFYALRLAGIPFQIVVYGLLAVNAPVLLLLIKQFKRSTAWNRRKVL